MGQRMGVQDSSKGNGRYKVDKQGINDLEIDIN